MSEFPSNAAPRVCNWGDCAEAPTHAVQFPAPLGFTQGFCANHARDVQEGMAREGVDVTVTPPVTDVNPLDEAIAALADALTDVELKTHHVATALSISAYTREAGDKVVFLGRRLDGVVAALHHAAWDRRARDVKELVTLRNAPQAAEDAE